jgi:hypothetical protein
MALFPLRYCPLALTNIAMVVERLQRDPPYLISDIIITSVPLMTVMM